MIGISSSTSSPSESDPELLDELVVGGACFLGKGLPVKMSSSSLLTENAKAYSLFVKLGGFLIED